MLIGELSQKTGLSRDTIRFYEKQGLIKVGRRERRGNNYKEYSADVLLRLQTITRMKGFGFTLNEIALFLDMMAAQEATCGQVSDVFAQKIALVNNKIQQLTAMRDQLLYSLKCCADAGNQAHTNCPIICA